MGLIASVTGEVEVRAVPGFRLTLDPARVVLDYGSVDMVARFAVGIVRDAGHDKTVYLDVLGLVGQWTLSNDQFIFGTDAPLAFEVDAAGFSEEFIAAFEIVGYDDVADRPVQEEAEA